MPVRSFPLPHKSLPLEIYISTVDALYSDGRSLFVGSISTFVAAFVTYWKSGDPIFLACMSAMMVIGVVRGIDMRAYAHQPARPATVEAARRWEVRYILGSAAYVLVLSTWCFLVFARTGDPVLQLIAFSLVLAYLLGITGRNFSSDQLVVTQTVCAAVPMIAGLLVQGDVYHVFLAFMFVPFFLGIRFISARLRGILFNAVVASHDIRELAVRFDTALNNMPHGLCMFDAEQKFVVANNRFGELLGLPIEDDLRGVAVRRVLALCEHVGTGGGAREGGSFRERFLDALQSRRRDTFAIETEDRKALEFTFQPMENGGCVVLAEDATARRAAEARIEHLARYDALTGLPNRTCFTEQFENLLSNARAPVSRALLFIDLDEFKQVNDTLGHPYGDALLCEVALRLRAQVREHDLIARFGGDEFVVLQTLQHGRSDATALAARIISTLSEIYDIYGHQIVVGASIGIAISPDDGGSVDQLLKGADMALYRAKAEGRGVWRFFEPDMDVKAQARRALELDIREALAREDFELHFQPIVNIRTGRTMTCEALLRWRHPTRGMVSPAEFIPVAEEMGLIVELGGIVLRKACTECASWPAEVSVAVNLSPIQFRRTNVEAVVREALAVSGLAPDRLEIEITETVLLQDTAATRRTLRRLRNMGVRVALDDFGTGYSSLSYLQAFPLSKVKIDRSFLAGVDVDRRAMKLLRGVARLSVELGMTVVVEGVETQQQLAALAGEASITEAQGFLFSKAIPGEEIRTYLEGDAENIAKVSKVSVVA